jgi:hypothetical protein
VQLAGFPGVSSTTSAPSLPPKKERPRKLTLGYVAGGAEGATAPG